MVDPPMGEAPVDAAQGKVVPQNPGVPTDPGAPVEEVRRRRSQLKAAMSSLQSALAPNGDIPTAQWCREVRYATLQLASALERHIAVHEGPDSFHAEILRNHPRLASRVNGLEHDHEVLAAALRSFQELVDRCSDGSAEELRDIRVQGGELLHQFVRHRRRGADVVWDAFEIDLGGEH